MAGLIDSLIAEQRDVEEHFAWSVITDPITAIEECGWLSHESFQDEQIREFWKKLKEVEVKEVGVATSLAMADGLYFRLFDACRSDLPIMAHKEFAAKIASSKFLRDVLIKNQEIVRAVGTRDINKVRQAMQDIEGISGEDGKSCGTPPDKAHEDFMEAARNPKTTVKCFLPQIDEMIGGYYPGEMTILAARPGMGKTALFLQQSRTIAYSNRKVLMVSIEMSRQQLWARMACGDAGLEWIKVRSGDITQSELDRLDDCSQALSIKLGKNLIIDDESMDIYSIHKSVIVNRPDIVFIDQLPDIVWHDPKAKPIEWIPAALLYLRTNIARRMATPLVIIHQLSREVEYRQDKHPQLSDLRETGVAEQRADIVLLGYRDDYYNGRPKDLFKVPFELTCAKHRQGNAGKVSAILEYDLKTQWFS